MRKNFGAKTWLYPMPVLIVGTYDENGNPNAMNAAPRRTRSYPAITLASFRQTTFPISSRVQDFTPKRASTSTLPSSRSFP